MSEVEVAEPFQFTPGGAGRGSAPAWRALVDRRLDEDGPRLLAAAAVLLATIVTVAAMVAIHGRAAPGIAVIAVGAGAALVSVGLRSPRSALVMLLLSLFFRQSLKATALPIELYHFAFGGAIMATALYVMRGRAAPPRLGATEVAMALFVLWNFGSAIATHPYPAINAGTNASLTPGQFIYVSAVIPFVMYYVCRVVVDRDAVVRTLLWALIGFTFYSALVSILPFYAPNLVWPRYIVEVDPTGLWSGRAVGIFKQPVANGLVLVVGFVATMHVAAERGCSALRRGVLGLLLCGTTYAVYLTHTRAVWLAFGIALAMGAVLMRRARTAFVATLVIIAGVIATNWSTFVSSDRAAGGVGSVGEVDDRLNMIATAWWAIQRHPLFGWGIMRFIPINTYDHQQWSGDIPWANGLRDSSHDNELGIAAELGLVGLTLWIAVLLLVLWQLWRAYRSLPREGLVGRELAAIGLIGLVDWIVLGQTIDLRFLDFAGVLVLLLAGMVVGSGERHHPAAAHTRLTRQAAVPHRPIADDTLRSESFVP